MTSGKWLVKKNYVNCENISQNACFVIDEIIPLSHQFLNQSVMEYRGLTKSEVEVVKQSLKGLPFTVKHEYFGGIQINAKSTAVMTVALAKSVVERLEKIEFLFFGLLEDSFRIFLSMPDNQELTRQFFRNIYAK